MLRAQPPTAVLVTPWPLQVLPTYKVQNHAQNIAPMYHAVQRCSLANADLYCNVRAYYRARTTGYPNSRPPCTTHTKPWRAGLTDMHNAHLLMFTRRAIILGTDTVQSLYVSASSRSAGIRQRQQTAQKVARGRSGRPLM